METTLELSDKMERKVDEATDDIAHTVINRAGATINANARSALRRMVRIHMWGAHEHGKLQGDMASMREVAS